MKVGMLEINMQVVIIAVAIAAAVFIMFFLGGPVKDALGSVFSGIKGSTG